MTRHTASSYIEGPRWSGIDTFIRQVALHNNICIDLVVDKRWLTIRVDYKVTGEYQDIMNFRQQLFTAVENYNAGRD